MDLVEQSSHYHLIFEGIEYLFESKGHKLSDTQPYQNLFHYHLPVMKTFSPPLLVNAIFLEVKYTFLCVFVCGTYGQ